MMVDKVAVDELIAEIDGYLAKELSDAIRRTLKIATAGYDCGNGACGCHSDDSTNERVELGFWSRLDTPARVTVVDDEIVDLECEYGGHNLLAGSLAKLRSAQVRQLSGPCRRVKPQIPTS